MIDGNTSTKFWANGNQIAGEHITFTFPETVNMSEVRIVQPSDVGADVINGADVQVAGDDGEWVTVGHMSSDSLDSTFEFEQMPVKQVRILITEDKENWYQISEVYFTYEQIEEDSTLKDLILEAEQTDISDKDPAKVQNMISALIEAQKVYASGSSDTEQVIASLRGALDELTITQPASDAAVQALQNMVEKAVALGSEDAALNEAIVNAQAVLAKETPTTTEVVTALLDLSEAMQALNTDESTDALRADVQATIDFIKENILTNTDNVRPGKVDALEAAVEAAQKLVDDPDASADDLKAANRAMTKAAQELWEIVSKAELNALIEAANGYLDGDYTAESLDALQAAIESAQTVAINDNATTAEVTEAITNLSDAIANLETITLDTSALEHEIELVTEMIANIGNYVPSSVEGLQEKLDAAKTALNNATTQAEIDEATKTLREARLNARTKADTSALEELIAYVNSLDLSAYTKESAQAVIQEAARAEIMTNDPEITQAEVDDMVKTLQASVDNLVEVKNSTSAEDTTNTAAAAQTGLFAGVLAAAAGALHITRKRRREKSE